MKIFYILIISIIFCINLAASQRLYEYGRIQGQPFDAEASWYSGGAYFYPLEDPDPSIVLVGIAMTGTTSGFYKFASFEVPYCNLEGGDGDAVITFNNNYLQIASGCFSKKNGVGKLNAKLTFNNMNINTTNYNNGKLQMFSGSVFKFVGTTLDFNATDFYFLQSGVTMEFTNSHVTKPTITFTNSECHKSGFAFGDYKGTNIFKIDNSDFNLPCTLCIPYKTELIIAGKSEIVNGNTGCGNDDHKIDGIVTVKSTSDSTIDRISVGTAPHLHQNHTIEQGGKLSAYQYYLLEDANVTLNIYGILHTNTCGINQPTDPTIKNNINIYNGANLIASNSFFVGPVSKKRDIQADSFECNLNLFGGYFESQGFTSARAGCKIILSGDDYPSAVFNGDINSENGFVFKAGEATFNYAWTENTPLTIEGTSVLCYSNCNITGSGNTTITSGGLVIGSSGSFNQGNDDYIIVEAGVLNIYSGGRVGKVIANAKSIVYASSGNAMDTLQVNTGGNLNVGTQSEPLTITSLIVATGGKISLFSNNETCAKINVTDVVLEQGVQIEILFNGDELQNNTIFTFLEYTGVFTGELPGEFAHETLDLTIVPIHNSIDKLLQVKIVTPPPPPPVAPTPTPTPMPTPVEPTPTNNPPTSAPPTNNPSTTPTDSPSDTPTGSTSKILMSFGTILFSVVGLLI